MPIDPNVFDKIKTFQDYQQAEEAFQLKKQLAAAQILSSQAEMKKASQLDASKLGEQAFLKAVQGQPLTPQEQAALQYLDAKTPTSTFNPVTGEMVNKPSLLDRAGLSRPASPAAPVSAGGTLPPQTQNQAIQEIFPTSTPPQSLTPNQPQNLTPKSQQLLQEKRITQQAGREEGYTKAQSALVSLGQKTKLITGTIDKALGTIENSKYPVVGSTATGYFSLANLPNSSARELKNHLETIKANIGFQELQTLREGGGTLGQVTEMENKLLQAVNGALDPAQEGQLTQNLLTIRELLPEVEAERKRAFEQDYGAFQPLGNNPVPPQPVELKPSQSGPQPGMVEDGYMFVGGNPADPKSWKKVQ